MAALPTRAYLDAVFTGKVRQRRHHDSEKAWTGRPLGAAGTKLRSDRLEPRLQRATARRPCAPAVSGRIGRDEHFNIQEMRTNECMFLLQVTTMGRGNSKKNKKKAPETKCSCLLFSGESSSPLIGYLSRLADDIISTELPPGEVQPIPGYIPGILIPRAQQVFFRLIHMVTQELEDGNYFPSISEHNIVVTTSDIVKIAVNNLEAGASAEDKSDSIHRLGDMIASVLQATSPSYLANGVVNPELSHLLGLMRDYQAGRSLFIINYPFCLIPLSNRSPAFIRIYDHTMDVLRFNNPPSYILVVDNVEIPPDWDVLLLGNEHLADPLVRGDYNMHTTRHPWIHEPILAPLNYLRNRPSHGQEGAASALDPRGVRFTPSDLARAMYIRMPFAFVSFQKSLHFVGELQNVDGFTDLFPGRLRFS